MVIRIDRLDGTSVLPSTSWCIFRLFAFCVSQCSCMQVCMHARVYVCVTDNHCTHFMHMLLARVYTENEAYNSTLSTFHKANALNAKRMLIIMYMSQRRLQYYIICRIIMTFNCDHVKCSHLSVATNNDVNA